MFMYWSCVASTWIIPKEICTWSVAELDIFLSLMIEKPELSHLHGNLCRLMVPLTISVYVLLSIYIGLGGSECPSLSRVSLMIFASWALRKRMPSSALAADAAISLGVANAIVMFPLSWIGWPF